MKAHGWMSQNFLTEAKLTCGTVTTFFSLSIGFVSIQFDLVGLYYDFIVLVCLFQEHFPSDCWITQGNQRGKGDRDDDGSMDPDPRLAATMEPKPLCLFQVTFAIFVVGWFHKIC